MVYQGPEGTGFPSGTRLGLPLLGVGAGLSWGTSQEGGAAPRAFLSAESLVLGEGSQSGSPGLPGRCQTTGRSCLMIWPAGNG